MDGGGRVVWLGGVGGGVGGGAGMVLVGEVGSFLHHSLGGSVSHGWPSCIDNKIKSVNKTLLACGKRS